MRPDRGSTPPPTPAGGDTDADATSAASPDTPPVASRSVDDLERPQQNELERPTLVPEIDLEALAKLGPEAFAHSKQRLPADLFGPGGKPSRPVRTSLPPGASMAPSAPPPGPAAGSIRPATFDLDEVDVFFDSDNKISIPPPRGTTHDEVATEPPDLTLDSTAELYALGSVIPSDARRTPPPPGHATVPRLTVASLVDDTDIDEPTLSNRLGVAAPPAPAPAPTAVSLAPPVVSLAPPVMETGDAIDALGMLDNPDSWDAGDVADLADVHAATLAAEAVAAAAREPTNATAATPISAEQEVSVSLRPLATAALDALSQLDEPDHDSGFDDDRAVPLDAPLVPLPPTRPQLPGLAASTAPPQAMPTPSPPSPSPSPPIESLPSDLLAEDDSPPPPNANVNDDEDDGVADAGADEAMQELRERYAAKDYLGALHIAETLVGDPLHAQEAEEIAAECRAPLQQRYVESIGSLARVPVIAVPLSVIRELPIDNRAGFVLSRIDGISSLEMILDMCGMPQLDALRIVYELIQNGALDFV